MSSMGWDPDEIHISCLERAAQIAALEGIAVHNALKRHPITDFVLNAPVEDLRVYSLMHPANSDFENQSGEDRRFVEWTLPGRDASSVGCGIRRSGAGLLVTACTADKTHYLKAAKLHCWRISCSSCFNDVCISRGADVEKRILAYADLFVRRGERRPDIKHWVISPPRDWAVSCLIDADRFDLFKQWVMGVMFEAGFLGGYAVVHPWRLSESHEWEVGPHVHIVGYGFVDNRSIVERYPGTVVKQIHPGERIRSVRHTIAYLLTHAGVGRTQQDFDEVDVSLDILNLYIPGLKSGYDAEPPDIDGPLTVDWTDFTRREYVHSFQTDWPFGCCSRRRIRIFDFYKVRAVRRCECGAPLATYRGFDDPEGEIAQYTRTSPIMILAENFDLVMTVWMENRDILRGDGMDVMDFAMIVPQLSCAETIGLEQYDSGASETRRNIRGMVIRYESEENGYRPHVMTREQAEEFDRTGVVPAGVFDPLTGTYPDTLSYASETLSKHFRQTVFNESDVMQ